MDKIIRLFLLLLLAGAAIAVWDGFFILPEGQQAVITQFGAPVGQPVTTAGIKPKIPFIQMVQYFDKRVLICDGEPNQIPTIDKTFIYLDTTSRWRIVDPLRFLQAVGTEKKAASLLNDIIAGTVRDLVNKHDLIEIIRSSDWTPAYMAAEVQSRDMIVPPKVGRDKISLMVLDAAAKITPQYGVELLDVMFRRVNYIEPVRLRVYDRMISERKRIAAEKRSTGEGRKAEILGRVDRELQEITSTAQREAIEIRGQADAAAAKIYAQTYSANPEFFAFQKSLESYRAIVNQNTSLILSADSDLFRYLESQKKR
ncbi:MAG: protease modulator HflC [Proteobacteria bacterium]|nr:protease modulator HflC [Pseudomonadota bacterium]